MKQRIITAIIAAAVFLPFLIFSGYLWVWLSACLILSTVAIGEMQNCIGTLKKWQLSVLAFAFNFGLLFLSAFSQEMYPLLAYALIMGLLLFSFLLSVFSKGQITASETVMSVMTTVYIAVSFASLLKVRYYPQGIWPFLLVFFLPWVTDTAAYFCGVTFGRHKLIPDVSPKKSVEGAIGGVVFAAGFVLLYLFLVHKWVPTFPRADYLAWGLSAVLLSVLSQCGDLIASLIKRQYGIKDYGKVFPGHGGVMDRFDSVLPCAICFYFLMEFGILKL